MEANSSAKNQNRFSRKRKTKDPCPECFLHKELCICSSIPVLDLKTRLCLVIHAKELKRTTNTGRLAIKALKNSDMKIRGLENQNLDLSEILTSDYQSVLFYPSEGALELNQEWVAAQTKPIQLIVPDGNWRQASKVHIRHKELSSLPRVMIKEQNQDIHFLRNEHKAEGMATLQAIAMALGIIEGAATGKALMELYQLKLSQTLKARGQIIS